MDHQAKSASLSVGLLIGGAVLRVGVIPGGVGFRLHIPVLRKLAGVEVLPYKLERIGTVTESPPAASDAELSALDLFLLGSPPNCHLPHVSHLLRLGVPVLCEKPVGLSEQEVRKMQLISVATGVECKANYQLRFSPAAARARRHFSLARPAKMTIVYRSGARRFPEGKPSWYWEPEKGGGVWFSLLSHLIDLSYFLGAEPTAAQVISATPETGPNLGMDSLSVRLATRSGLEVLIVADALAAVDSFSISLGADRDIVDFDMSTGLVAADSAVSGTPWDEAFSALCQSVVGDGTRVDLSGCATLEDARRVHRVVRAVRSSLASGMVEAIAD